ncbi:hypothetical protein [Bdellovibrio sp. KM01]|uniref:hypothetical protein n=1 Tax=Bdellovibrio sp. KM01 TaxID=2748865 RepID=UPI0015EAA3C8|nr:hypothetical protein [Bdellovibrio sp. KM01]QLY27042.1 hypothetical protein HW988_08625 [Bdellovibrio sp. KM01]
MKRIALCLYGKFNNRLSKNSGMDGFEYIKEHILNNQNVDVFIHSWDLENENVIKKCYGAYLKTSTFEQQKSFKQDMTSAGVTEEFFIPPGGQAFRTVENSLSFFFSRKESISLKAEYEQKNNFKYDVVVVSRFDLGQMDKYNQYQPYKVSEIVFDVNKDMKFVYSAMWNQLNEGYADMWFYSSSENIDTLGEMYQRSLEYLAPDSKFLKTIEIGLPDSNRDNPFSNEMLSESDKSPKTLVTFSPSQGLNNHLLHKWFFMDSGLYEKSKFLGRPSTTVCTVMYSHTDYSDVWPLYFGQLKKHRPNLGTNFVFVNKHSDLVPEGFEQVIFDDKQSYPERLLHCFGELKKRGFEYCLFEHEDMPLVADIDYKQIETAINLLIRRKHPRILMKGLDSIRLIKASQSFSVPVLRRKNIYRMLPISKWLFSVQPTLWNIDAFIALLSKHKGNTIWELEQKAQKTCRKLNLRCGYMHRNGVKRGTHHWDNNIYPYIATAIVKGKWNFKEYKQELQTLLPQYGINANARGKFED